MKLKRITAEDLHDCLFLGEDGTVLDPATTTFVLMASLKSVTWE